MTVIAFRSSAGPRIRWVVATALFATVVLTAAAFGQAAPPPPATPQQPAPIFRTGADVVSVDASVQRERRPVTGLTAGDFELLDNGVAQEVTDVAYEKLPIDVTLLLDVSASVTGSVLDELRRALRQVRTDLGPADRLRLLTFNMRVRRLVDFTQPAADIDQALGAVRSGGSSAVFDALAVALTGDDAPGRRRLIVLFSDGQDSSSISDADGLVDVARRSTPTIATILGSPVPERPASVLRTNASLASATVDGLTERLASETGGMVTSVKTGENLTSKFRRMVQDFRSSYVLYFTPKGVDRAGAHTLDVRVKRPGVDVRARRGYIWRRTFDSPGLAQVWPFDSPWLAQGGPSDSPSARSGRPVSCHEHRSRLRLRPVHQLRPRQRSAHG
jgi:Ca-activated chloride channel family protein